MVKFRMELPNLTIWAFLKNHEVHIVELVRLQTWSAEHGYCINMNKLFEDIPDFKAYSFSLKLP